MVDIQGILNSPEVQRLLNHVNVNHQYSVPYFAGANKTGGITYIDKNVPLVIPIGGKQVDISKYIHLHEQAEYSLMEKGGMSYKDAHNYVTNKVEKPAVEADGVDWEAYKAALRQLISVVKKAKPTNIPPDLYAVPYEHDGATKLISAMKKRN